MKRPLVHSAWLAFLLGLPGASALAQTLPPVSSLPGGHREPTGPVTLELAPAPDDTATPAVPPTPAPAAPPPRPVAADEPGLTLRGVRIAGGEALPQEGLAAIYQPYVGQWVTLSDLEELRYRLTKYYVDQGYLNSGAIIPPDQTIDDGVVTFRIVTGVLETVQVSGQGRLRPGYIAKRLQPDPGAPFNRNDLQERFQLLLEDPLIQRLDGNLRPGAAPGSAVLDVAVERARPWSAFLRTDNYRPPSTGATRLYGGGALHNPTGFGDLLDLSLGIGEAGEGREAVVSYNIPVNAADTRLFARYENTDSSLLEEPLAELDIASETERYEIGVAHPFWRSLEHTLRVGALLHHAENTTTLLDEPFSFSEGAVDGETQVSALRVFQEYARRQTKQAYALRSVFSWGLDTLDATIHDRRPDSRFFAWLGQGQYVRQLAPNGLQLMVRGGIQLASETLLPLERFAVGGVNTVRGYRENTLVADNGYAASLELRYPLWAGTGFGDLPQTLQLAVYTDVGGAWNHGRSDMRETLYSLGAGAIWTLAERLRAELYIAHAFNDPVPASEYDLQDDGIHFMVQATF